MFSSQFVTPVMQLANQIFGDEGKWREEIRIVQNPDANAALCYGRKATTKN